MSIKILLAEDHELTRKGIAYGLKKFDNLDIVAEATNGLIAVELAAKHKPDIIIMDIMMPVLNGIEATKKIKSINKNIKIIMLTSYNEKEKVLSAFHSGANAYCIKDTEINNLVDIIKTVMEGSLWIDHTIAGYILEILQSKSFIGENQKETYSDFNLTNREKEVLKLVADGLNNRDISEKLFLSLHTVKNHIRSIFRKLVVEDRTQAVIIALKEKIF